MRSMRFVVHEGRYARSVTTFPTVVLWRDNWDDYGYKTMFAVRLHLDADTVLDLEQVKILERGQTSGYTQLPETSFASLEDDFCSLGQSFSYYELLQTAGPDVYELFLRGLQDAVFQPEVHERFKLEPGFETSLLRFDPARRALVDAPFLFDDLATELPASQLSFGYRFPQRDATISFEFGQPGDLPNRLYVVIGYNGSGKTRLLANLARLTFAGRRTAEGDAFVAVNGEYVGTRPEFGSILAVSYSAFDDFTLPEDAGGYRSSVRNYTYCGLRVTEATDSNNVEAEEDEEAEDEAPTVRLKDFDQLEAEFHEARHQALQKHRTALLAAASVPIFDEPSFRTVVDVPALETSGDDWHEAFTRLSAGHKIVLHIVVQICAYLDPHSLVLIDEPELHLHPPLVAALLRSINAALERYDSFAVVATHSPVVLQEVPARNVRVLRRSFDEIAVEPPDIETFAENLGLLTRQVFSLDSSNTDYQGVLRRLAADHSLDEIEEMFPRGLSSQARSLVMSLQHMRNDAG